MAREPTAKERERMARGRRYDPGKPQPPWHERPPEPKPPTLEPVIPQPYIPPIGGKAVEWDAKGNVTVLQTPDGEKHYTPFFTTMWGELGFKTQSEYLESQMTGQPSHYIGVTEVL